MVTQELCYQNHKPKWTVTILEQDITDLIENTIRTSKSLDTVNLTEVEVANATIDLQNEDNNFSTDRASNFFTTNRHVHTGYKAPIVIRAGFDINGTTQDKIIFTGYINDISFSPKSKIATITAVDNTSILRENTVDNFGLQKSSRLSYNTAGTNIYGEYPFAEHPVSDESVYPFLNGEVMKNIGQLEGIEYSQKNFALNEDRSAIQTQVAVTGPVSLITSLYKVPYRNISIERSIARIIDRYRISKRELAIRGVSNAPDHFSSRGKVQYAVNQSGINTAQTEQFRFNGFITDYLFDEDNQTFYFLESSFDSDINPRIISYNLFTDSHEVEYTAASHFEWWQITTGDFNTFYIGQTTGTWSNNVPSSGAYNPAQTGAQTSILQWVRGASPPNNAATYNSSGNRRYTPAYFYSYGFNSDTSANSIRNNTDYGFRPDSRFGFIYHNDKLYFRFTNSTESGVATMTSTGTIADVYTFPNDERNNECSHDFTIDTSADLLYGSHTRKSLTDSVHITYEKDIS